jgi:hypothetical protein
MLAAHVENLLFLLLIAAAFLFQLLTKAVGKASKDQPKRTSTPVPRTPAPIRRAPTESDEERIRRFLEALGQPTESRPPPPVVPRTDVPPRPVAPVQPPIAPFAPLWKASKKERRKRDVILKESPPPPTVSRVQEIVPPKITGAPAFEIHEGPLPIEAPSISKTPVQAYAAATRPITQGAEPKTDIATLLASKSGLRDAIILREIFGPPRGLQSPDALL